MEKATPINVQQTPLILFKGLCCPWKEIWIKDETQQVTGAFKFRGNMAKLSKLPSCSLVVTASTGNHANGLATAAKIFGHTAKIFVPKNIPRKKLDGIKKAGATPILVNGDYFVCEEKARQFAMDQEAIYIPSFDDLEIIEGHRTLCQEIDQQGVKFDTAFVPVGGGGLLSACLTHWGSKKRIVAVESVHAPALKLSLEHRQPVYLESASGFAEGLMVRRIGDIPFSLCNKYQPEVSLLPDEVIKSSISSLWRYNQIRAEGAGAASLAAALYDSHGGEACLCIVSGGNIDDDLFQEIIDSY
ncbi:threonine/serine dehydratase [Thermoactinomyces sp. DSM 45892]|uniref:threonine ammonia-lyase n=1 Tax=Thermoactinomyces sp. DSM 45892 TaxID=1882753 RepID=UPI00089CEEF9|nr:pyridoxal-phosphate dependent enzyme [Thermoactinomyces sp. DSM 45892]SDY10884.1 L-threonine ammonia-lyase [Thermoactinomyces sp. DSM 45892]